MYKAFNMDLPNNIQSLFQINNHQYKTRQTDTLTVKQARTSLRSSCVTVKGIKIWNDLNENLKSLPNLHQFRRNMKYSLLAQYKSN